MESVVPRRGQQQRPRPENVGILAMEIYFPSTFVSQTDLENFDRVGSGKYTQGLGQVNLAFCGDNEDINSICLTAVSSLLEKYGVSPANIGRLEVGTETIVDKSKSVKTVLMQLFEESGNTSIEGIDTTNACYGGTAALFNAVNWVESSWWDGRLAIVVAGDIAVYPRGPARPTGGCGVIAMLVGPDAPLVLETGLNGTHMENAWDFYKPRLSSEYPLVDGRLSISCYLKSLDLSYQRYRQKYEQKHRTRFSLLDADFAIFHQPYRKLVIKSVARLLYNDFLQNPSRPEFASEEIQKYKTIPQEKTYLDRNLETIFLKLSKEVYQSKVEAGTQVSAQIGNAYTASLYVGLLSLITEKATEELLGKRIMMFSYGSGSASTLFSIVSRHSSVFTLDDIRQKADVQRRLRQRRAISAEEFTNVPFLPPFFLGHLSYFFLLLSLPRRWHYEKHHTMLTTTPQ
ncbi:Hydroxymethylglutaryl-CoA synthase, variant 2 [Balamuthia mandrillaris]